jgi:hypothetical protein
MSIEIIHKLKKTVFFIMLLLGRNISNFSEESRLLITIESNKERITNDDNIIFTVCIKNIADNEYKLNLHYFMFTSFYLKFYYYDSFNQKINIPLSTFGIISAYLKTSFKILKPNETYSITMIGTYKYIDNLRDIRTLKRYTGMAFVFDDDYSFFPVPPNINKLEISYYATEELNTNNMLEINISNIDSQVLDVNFRDL